MPVADDVWRAAMEHSPLGMTAVAVDGELLLVNPAFCRMLGRSEAELRTLGYEAITHPDDRESSVRQFRRAAAGDLANYRVEKRYVHADGSVVWVDLSVVVVRDDLGGPQFLVAQVVDITAQHRDREELVRVSRDVERERLMADAILDSVDVGLVLIDRDGAYERMNRRHHDFLALAYPEGHHGRAGQVGLAYFADGTTLLGADDLPSTRAARGEEFDDCRIWIGDDPLTRRALAVSARSVHDETGAFVGGAMAYVDVTVLVSALQVQQTLLGCVSHELRTPLTPILGHLELLHDLGDAAPATVGKSLAAIRRNAVRLERLVADLLLEMQRQTEGIGLDRTDTDVAALLVQAATSAGDPARRAGVALAVDLGPTTDGTGGTATCFVDAERLRQVLDHLIANAVKYTDAGGSVTASCCQEPDGAVVLVVTDTGVGIAAEDLAHVFDPFYRTGQARARQAGGLGLGLGIVRAIVDAHGWDLEVESEPGRGTTVQVRLPRLDARPGVAEVR